MFPSKKPKAFSIIPFDVDLEEQDVKELIKFRDNNEINLFDFV